MELSCWIVFQDVNRGLEFYSRTPGSILCLTPVLQTCCSRCLFSQRLFCCSVSPGVLVFTFIGVYICMSNCLKALKPVFILKLPVNSDGSELVFSFFCVDLASLSCFAFSEFDVY